MINGDTTAFDLDAECPERADESEVERLRALEQRGAANGLEGLRWLRREEMREIEPHVGGVAGLRVPQEGIVDYARVCEAMVALIESYAPLSAGLIITTE